jgi:hypothetical protein
MTSSDIYSVGDSVRFVDRDGVTRFATIESVDAIWRRYAVVYTREQLHDKRELVAHDDVVRYRKSVYVVGDVVELYPESTHEGPHESDVDNVSPVAMIERVETHPHNDEWVVGYAIVERDEQHVERRFVKPGSVARLSL